MSTDYTIAPDLVSAIDGARSEMQPGDVLKMCQSTADTCTREEGCTCPEIKFGDPRTTAELVAEIYGVRQ